MECLALLEQEPDNEKFHGMYTSAVTKFDALAGRIGLTPHSRRVIKPAKGEGEAAGGEFDEWLKRGNLN
jgi:hypothetical protein